MNKPDFAEFVYQEARLLDEKRFDEWYDLFDDDARYWMPLSRNQPEDPSYTSLFYEDKLLLKVRIERLKHPRAYSQEQASYCQHVLQQPQLEKQEGEILSVRTPFFYMETQLDNQVVLSGVYYHTLCEAFETFRIRQKRIELVNRDAALPSIQLLI